MCFERLPALRLLQARTEGTMSSLTADMRRAWCRLCYWVCLRWPFSCYSRIPWRVYLWLLPWAGEEAYRRGEL